MPKKTFVFGTTNWKKIPTHLYQIYQCCHKYFFGKFAFITLIGCAARTL